MFMDDRANTTGALYNAADKVRPVCSRPGQVSTNGNLSICQHCFGTPKRPTRTKTLPTGSEIVEALAITTDSFRQLLLGRV